MNFAYWHGASFKWDPAKHEFVSGGDSKWLTREYRGDFKGLVPGHIASFMKSGHY